MWEEALPAKFSFRALVDRAIFVPVDFFSTGLSSRCFSPAELGL